MLNLCFMVHVLLHDIICYSGNQKSGIRPVWLVPGVEMCDQLLDQCIKTYMSKRWLCSELFWIDFSNVTVFQKHFWNYSFVISLLTSTSFFYLYSLMANDICWEWIWYLEKMGRHSELSLIQKIREQNEKCHF